MHTIRGKKSLMLSGNTGEAETTYFEAKSIGEVIAGSEPVSGGCLAGLMPVGSRTRTRTNTNPYDTKANAAG
jgi:predicted Rossmann-fold nucleotide-binding protein